MELLKLFWYVRIILLMYRQKEGIVLFSTCLQVPLSSLKFDQNKCYVLGAENGIFVYVGNEEQKELTMNLANHIMDDSMYLMNGKSDSNIYLSMRGIPMALTFFGNCKLTDVEVDKSD